MGIRFERESDRPSIRALHLAAFGDHGKVVADLVDDLRSAVAKDEGLSLVAEESDEVVGHAMLTPSWLDAPRRLVDVQVLSPVGVVPDWQKRGIGSALIRRGIELLIEGRCPGRVRGRSAGLLLALRVRRSHGTEFQEAVAAHPRRGVPSAASPVLRAMDDGNLGLFRHLLATRCRWTPRSLGFAGAYARDHVAGGHARGLRVSDGAAEPGLAAARRIRAACCPAGRPTPPAAATASPLAFARRARRLVVGTPESAAA